MITFLWSCGGGGSTLSHPPDEVVIHNLSDPDMLNPTNYQAADAEYICKRIFGTLMWLDFKTLEFVPYLAESKAAFKENKDGSVDVTYKIRQEAIWDDGTPVTAKDAEFSLKVLSCPGVNSEQQKPYFDKLSQIILYPDDPKKISLHFKEKYIQLEAVSGDFFFLQSKLYDPKGIMANYSFEQIIDPKSKEDAKLKEFAIEYNGEKYKREKGFVAGCGPYSFDTWVTNQRIIIKKKANWWGDKFFGSNTAFENNAPTLVYEVVKDMTTAVNALKSQKFDAMYGIKPKDFIELDNSESFKTYYKKETPNALAYAYFGLNTKNPKFADKKIRQALAHLIDVDKMIETLYYGMATRVNCDGIPGVNSDAYNTEIVPFDFNIEKAKTMLAAAGWNDTDGDGTLDKMINGQKTKFTIDYTFNTGNDIRQNAGMIFKEAARQVGIEVNVVGQEWALYIKNQQDHKFEMFYGSWIKTPANKDPKQIWHTESYNGGSNYTGFGTPESDKLIEEIRTTLDMNKYNELMKKLQAIQHDEASYIFLYAPKERIAIHKRFENTYTTIMRPGFNDASFKVAALK